MLASTPFIFISFFLGRVYGSQSRLDYLDVVPIEKAPFLALVLCNNNKYFCSGTILQESWVLTAAHCLYEVDGTLTEEDSSVFVVAGTNGIHQAKQDIERGDAQIRQSVQLVVYERYRFSENFLSDMVLIKLQSPLNITKSTNVAPLDPRYYKKPTLKEKNINTFTCSFYGFGKVYKYTDTTEDGYLKKQMIHLYKECTCLDFVWSIQWHSIIPKDNLICEAEDINLITMSGLCSGDQGAPLICKNYLRGLGNAAFQYEDRKDCSVRTNGENECGSHKTMSVFTDLCPYSQWITYNVPGLAVVNERCEDYELT